MPQQQTAIPPDLLELSQRLEQWRSEQQPRSRLPESIWAAAVELAKRHGLHRTTKAPRLDYTGLKNRMAPAAAGPGEYVVEWESVRGRMRVAMKGATPDWASLLRAWREN